jgi:hypothetical protein
VTPAGIDSAPSKAGVAAAGYYKMRSRLRGKRRFDGQYFDVSLVSRLSKTGKIPGKSQARLVTQ